MIPEALVPTVLYLAHDAIVAGHPGQEGTLTALRTHYFWPTMKIYAQKHVERCAKCSQYKGVLNNILHLAVLLIVSALTYYNFLLFIKGVNTS